MISAKRIIRITINENYKLLIEVRNVMNQVLMYIQGIVATKLGNKL